MIILPSNNKIPTSLLPFQCPDEPLRRPIPPPSPALSLRERMTGSLKRIIGPQHRPLPDTPDQQQQKRNSVTSTGSVFDQIRRPPSVVMEKIKQQSMLALDRISSNQEKYRQQQNMNGNRSPMSNNGQIPVSEVMSILLSHIHCHPYHSALRLLLLHLHVGERHAPFE